MNYPKESALFPKHLAKCLFLASLFLICSFSTRAAERMTVAWFDAKEGPHDTNTDYCRFEVNTLMAAQLFEVKSIRLLPNSSIAYAYRQLKMKMGQAPTTEQALKLGQTIEARRVVWLDYHQEEGKCSMTMRIVNVATGKSSEKIAVSGPDWFQVTSNSVNAALMELGIVPTVEERARMTHLPTRSAEALDLFARGMDKNGAANQLSDSEPFFRRAAAADPDFSTPLTALAQNIIMGRDGADEAEQLAVRAVKIRPDYPSPHYVLGIVYELRNMNHLAYSELQEAVRLNPDDPDNYDRLGEICARMGRSEEAIKAWKEATALAPYDVVPHASMGTAFAMLGKRDEALAELQLAEHFRIEDDPAVDQRLANAYEALKDAPRYVEHAEKFIAAAKKMGAQTTLLADAETDLAHWKAFLDPHFVTASKPRTYTLEELNAALRARLTPQEFQSVTNPLGSTPEMEKWASELTAGAPNSQEKARRLFDGLTHHLTAGISSASGRPNKPLRSGTSRTLT